MYSWDPDDVERITPFTPSCYYQKQESTWRVDDVDRISPFTPIRQNTWSIDDVDQIESFVPTNNSFSSSTSSSSIQYSDATSSTPFIPTLATSLARFKNASVISETQDSEYPQSRLFEVHSAETRASSSPSFSSALEHSLNISAESDSNSPNFSSKHEESTLECEPIGNKEFNIHALVHLIEPSSYSRPSNSSEDEQEVKSNNRDLNTSDELDSKCSSSQCRSSNSSPQYNLDSLAEYLHQNSSFEPSVRSSYNSVTSVPTQYDVDTLVEILRQQYLSNETSNNSVECDLNTSDEFVASKYSYSNKDLTPAGSCEDSTYVSDDDSPLFENAEGSLEMSTQFVVQEPAKNVDFLPTVSNHNTGNYCDGSSSSKDDEPLLEELESQSSRACVDNPYDFNQPCIAATNLIGRGVGISSHETEVDLKEELIRRRLKMDPSYVPSIGRGAILKSYSNRHKTDKSLNEQLRMTLGVGYSNEATENFWRGEQEESEPLEKPSEKRTPSPTEVENLVPAAEPSSSVADIIYVSPCDTTYHKKKTPEYPPIITVPVEKYTSPAKTTACPPSSTSHQGSSPKKKKKTAATRKNRNALLNSLATQKGAEKQTMPGMPPGALTYVNLDTSNKFTEQNGFHYEKEDFPPLC